MKTNTGKKRTAVVAAFVAVLLLLTGTFAWTSFSQRALNEKSGVNEAGGRIHDDYNKENGNKDIYAENYSTQNLIVRIKLSEYLENNGESLFSGATKDDKSSWTPYTLNNNNVFRDYLTWELGGEKVYLPTFNTNKDDKSVDASGDAIDVLTNGQTAEGDGTHDYFTAGQEVANPDDATVKHTAVDTLSQDKAPISMADWKNLPAEQQKGNYWVIDTDGWAYWANVLAPGESTSLLLNQLNWNKEAVGGLDDWYYGIDVIGEFVSLSDKDKFPNSTHGAPSKDASNMISSIVGEDTEVYTYAMNFTEDVSKVEMESREGRKFGVNVIKTDSKGNNSNIKPSDLTWSLTPSTAGTVDNTGKVILNRIAEKTSVTVTVSSKSLNLSNSFKINTTPFATKVGEEFTLTTNTGESDTFIYLKDLGNGNRLVLRKYLLPSGAANSTAYNGSDLDNAMKAYYATLSTESQLQVQPVQKSFNVGEPKDATAIGLDLEQFLVTTPANDRAVVTPDGEKKAFALSVDELNDVSGLDKPFSTVNSRGAFKQSDVDKTVFWWLRTPNTDTFSWYVRGGSAAGQLNPGNSTSSAGSVRPAMIINR